MTDHRWFEQFYHFTAKEKKSGYRFVGKKEDVIYVHVYLKEKNYKRLKHIHHNLNFYSISQILRFILKKFLIYNEFLGFKGLIRELDELRNKLIKSLPKKINKIKKMRQLSSLSYYNITYNDYFSPLYIKLLFKT